MSQWNLLLVTYFRNPGRVAAASMMKTIEKMKKNNFLAFCSHADKNSKVSYFLFSSLFLKTIIQKSLFQICLIDPELYVRMLKYHLLYFEKTKRHFLFPKFLNEIYKGLVLCLVPYLPSGRCVTGSRLELTHRPEELNSLSWEHTGSLTAHIFFKRTHM